MEVYLGWAYLASEWAIRIVMTPVVVRRRRPGDAMAWLVAIFFIPWVGLVAYLMLGTRWLGRVRLERHLRAQEALADAAPPGAPTGEALAPEAQRDLVRLCDRLGGLPLVGGNHVELIADTDVMIDRLIHDIEEAHQHVHLLYYIFRHDDTGRRVAEACRRAAGRGVTCRMLLDGVGSRRFLKKAAPSLRAAGVDVRSALPATPLRRLFARLDLRNHRKIAVIDGRAGYTGSQNIVDADYGRKRVGAWHDLSMRIVGPSVWHLQAVFAADWYGETGQSLKDETHFPRPEQPGDVPVQAVHSGPQDETDVFRTVTIAAIAEAERRVVLTTPYLVLDESVTDALRVAALRGVTVDLVVPERGDQRIVAAAGRANYDDLLGAGVRLHLFQGGLLHAKTLSVDDAFAMVTSGNLDMRSFRLNFELSMLLYCQKITQEVVGAQERYIAGSRPLAVEQWRRRPRWRPIADNVARLLSPIL